MRWHVPGQREGQQVRREPRIDSRHEDSRISLSRSRFDAFDVLVGNYSPRVLQHPESGPHHVDTRGEDAAYVGHRRGQSGIAHCAVHDAVGFGRDDPVQVTGGRNTGLHLQPGQLAGVAAHLGV